MAIIQELASLSLPTLVGLGIVLYVVGILMYRLYFSPIASFPGPLLARATFWYEFWYNWAKNGQYYRQIGEMHKKYGTLRFFSSNQSFFLIFFNFFLGCLSLPYLTLKQAQLSESHPQSSISWMRLISTRFLWQLQSESRIHIYGA